MPRRLLLPLLVMACGASLPAAGAQAATPGVNIAGIPGVAEIDAAAASGARYVRVFARWPDFQPSGPQTSQQTIDTYRGIAGLLGARGMKAVLVLTDSPAWASGSTDPRTPPRDPGDYARWAGEVAGALAGGNVAAYEIWNEEDESAFWSTGPDPVRYAALLKASYASIKAADRSARVLLGPLTGNNYAFLEQLYQQGAKGSFDAAAVHTDTACLVAAPDGFYRENGRIGRFTFLGFREVRATMLANGDDKPIWMTELGWTSTTTPCERGVFAGQKPAGVTEAQQAENLRAAFHCLADYDYLEAGLWFTLRDAPTEPIEELRHYGLLRADGARKPAWEALRAVATRGDAQTRPCGDFDGPKITIRRPTSGTRYSEGLVISAVATDGNGVARVTFKADGKHIRNFTGSAAGSGRTVRLEWQASKRLSLGRHTITVQALDPQGNATSESVGVVRVEPSKLGRRLRTRVSLGTLRLKGRTATLAGRVRKSGELGLGGKVEVRWQWRSTTGRAAWKTLHKGRKNANRPFRFEQRLKRAGQWRAQVRYTGRPPYRGSSLVKRFRVR